MKKVVSLVLILGLFGVVSFIEENAVTQNMIQKVQAAEYKQVQAMHILVPTEEEALSIREEIMTGANQQEIFNNFMNAAKKYSKCPSGKSGGILGWFGRGDMVKEFEDTAFSIPNGQVSEPVKTQFGYHLIYVISKK